MDIKSATKYVNENYPFGWYGYLMLLISIYPLSLVGEWLANQL